MTVDEMLALARRIADPLAGPIGLADAGRDLARAVLALLDHPAPCGWPDPVVERDDFGVWIEFFDDPVDADEMRAVSVMQLRAADAADALAKEPT